MSAPASKIHDIFIIGGGINGCGIARDAAGRGFSVFLCEAGDLGGGTSSASTKLIHGGLRYLEYYKFRLVREALVEREVIWQMAPHIVSPMRFVLPHHKGLRPKWLLRLGLFFYDHLGGRKLLPASTKIDLSKDEAGKSLKPGFETAFEYSDCWVQDSRLVILNAMDAAQKGAKIQTRTRVVTAKRQPEYWDITTEDMDTGQQSHIKSRVIINAAGPWVDDVLRKVFRQNKVDNVRLVRGSHIVINKKFDHDRCYFFQNSDNRLIFAIPYENEYTLIGTTDMEHNLAQGKPKITPEETEYLCNMASEYFAEPVTKEDIVWTFSGVRPLYNDGASAAQEATRDYIIKPDNVFGSAGLFNIFGGKITTYRKLSEAMMLKIEKVLPKRKGKWTRNAKLPGGDFAVHELETRISDLQHSYSFLPAPLIDRLFRTYGTRASMVLENVNSLSDLGEDFGGGLFQKEVDYLCQHEWACTADDILFRRTKLGIKISEKIKSRLSTYLAEKSGPKLSDELH